MSCFVTSQEINFLIMCCDENHDGKIDYLEFTERFHNPAKEIGFNLAVLLTNLSEHMPNDPRWEGSGAGERLGQEGSSVRVGGLSQIEARLIHDIVRGWRHLRNI